MGTNRIFLVLLFHLPLFSFTQNQPHYDIMPKGVDARPLLDSLSYLPDSLRRQTIATLKAKGFDLSQCFVDKDIQKDEKEGKVHIRIWDVEDLKFQKQFERSKRVVPYTGQHFYSGTILYDLKTKTCQFFGDE